MVPLSWQGKDTALSGGAVEQGWGEVKANNSFLCGTLAGHFQFCSWVLWRLRDSDGTLTLQGKFISVMCML